MPVVYVGPITALATALQGELADEQDFLAKLKTHSASRAQSLKAGRALLKYALRQQGLLAQGELLPPIVTGELGKPYLQWPKTEAGAVQGAEIAPESKSAQKFAFAPKSALALESERAQEQLWEFNLSHAHGLIALSLGQGPMGIDIECCTRKHFRVALLNAMMSPEERLVCAALGRELAQNRRGSIVEADALSVTSAMDAINAMNAIDSTNAMDAKHAQGTIGALGMDMRVNADADAGAVRNAVQYWDGQRYGATASFSSRVQSVLSGAGAVNGGACLEPLSAAQLQVAESELSELSKLTRAPAWAHIAELERHGYLAPWQRQCLWWTQQWTVRECALKVLGKSIFAHEQMGFDLPHMQVHLAGMPQGAIHCYNLWTSNEIDAAFARPSKAGEGAKNSAISPVLLLSQEPSEAEYVLSVFVPLGEKLTLNLWLNNNWHESSLNNSCAYQISPT